MSRPATGVIAAHALTMIAGAAIALQVRVNAELGVRLGSEVVAAAVSFAGGLLVAGAVVCASPRSRAAMRQVRRWSVPAWTYLAGIGGAVFMAVAIAATPILGVALVSIAAVAGQLGGGLVADHLGLAGTRRAMTLTRLAGGAVALAAVAVGYAAHGVAVPDIGTTVIVIAGGFAIAVQAALNSRLRTAASPAVATTINFAVGLAALGVLLLVLAAGGRIHVHAWPANPMLYAGGALGAVIIAAIAVTAASIGVLRMTLAIITGQLAAAAVLDAAWPGGPGHGPAVLVAAALTLVAVAIAGYHSTESTPRIAPSEPGRPLPVDVGPVGGRPSSRAPA